MYNQELQNRVNEVINKGLSQVKLAKLTGLSQTALSQWRKNKYTNGDIISLEKKLEEYFRLYDTKNEVHKSLNFMQKSDYVPISTSEDVYKLIQYCHFEKGMVVAHGDAGIGKTKGAEKYVKENPGSTIYIQVTPALGTSRNILKLLARALKISDKGDKLELVLDIKNKLSQQNKVIIIDEAQHLKYASLEEIRSLTDTDITTGVEGTGIVLIGNTEVYDKMVGKQEARFAQLFSRIKMNRYYTTSGTSIEDIRKLFPEIAEDKTLDFMLGIAQSKWGIRGAVNVYNNAVSNENITKEGILGMARGMGIGAIA